MQGKRDQWEIENSEFFWAFKGYFIIIIITNSYHNLS